MSRSVLPNAETSTSLRAGAPLIDVVLPVRNFGRFLVASIPSILAQTESRFRLIAVDYGSTDDTLDILSDFARRDRRIDVVRLGGDSVLTAALVEGCQLSRAPFIARHDADDVSLPGRFARQLEVLSADPDVAAVSGSCSHIDAAGRKTGTRFTAESCENADCRALPAREPLMLQPFVMMRRAAYERAGGYRRAFASFSEDSDLFWRLAKTGKLVNLTEEMGLMRVHSRSLTNASIVNGRLLAVYSQLAALSARRREEGRRDLDFSKIEFENLRRAASLEHMLEQVSTNLSDDEARHLRSAAAIKLLEIAAVRMLALQVEDCLFVRSVYDGLEAREIAGRCVANWALRTTIVRFVRQNKWDHLAALTSPVRAARVFGLRLSARQRRADS